MDDAPPKLIGAEVEWSLSTTGSVTETPAKNFFARGAIEVLDDSPNRSRITGKNFGPQIIHVFIDAASRPPDISPGESFTIAGEVGRIMIRVL